MDEVALIEGRQKQDAPTSHTPGASIRARRAVVHKPAPRVVAPAGLNACHMRPSASVPIARVDLAVRRPLLRGARAGRNGRCASGVAPYSPSKLQKPSTEAGH